MAERRMFAKTIIDSDAFLDMPLSSQALYFHLSMRADDDGFINNPKKIQRMVGCGDDDLKLLIAKNFIIPFESGIVVIKHWKIHNYIQKDRYKETVYQEEKALLAVKENKSYTLDCRPLLPPKNECIQDVYSMETQVRLGKDRIGKVSIDKGSEVTAQQIADLFNDTCVSFPKIRSLSSNRKKAIKARLNTYSLDDFIELFRKAEASNFLKGANERNWTASFDWLIKDSNMAKVLEGNYDNKAGKRKEPIPDWMNKKESGFNNFQQREYDMDALESALLNKPAELSEDLQERVAKLKEQLGGAESEKKDNQ